MTPVIQYSINNILLVPGPAFAVRRNNCLTRCSPARKPRQLLSPQKLILPLSSSVSLFPQYRKCHLLCDRSASHILSATGADVAVEEPDASVADDLSTEGSEVLSDAAETGNKSTIKSDSSPASSQSRQSRQRKSEMPPVKNEELIPGATFTGKVRSIQPFGAFVDFGAFTDGLVHVSRLSDSFVKDVASVVSIGQEVKVKLVEVNTETGRISLSMREFEDPSKRTTSSDKTRPPRKNASKASWRKEEMKSSKFVKGQGLEGTVKNLTRSGAFISLPEGEEGFLPISEEFDDGFGDMMESSSLQTGQEVKVRVLRIARGQVTLTMKTVDDSKLDLQLGEGVVHAATNPFVLAFRKNKDIAAFLDQREKQEIETEKPVKSESSEEIIGKANQSEAVASVPDVQIPPTSSDEEVVSSSSEAEETVENVEASSEESVSDIADKDVETTEKETEKSFEKVEMVENASQIDTVASFPDVQMPPSASEETVSISSAAEETVEIAEASSEETVAASTDKDDNTTEKESENSSGTANSDGVESSASSDSSEYEQIKSSESQATEEVVENQVEPTKDEVQTEISTFESQNEEVKPTAQINDNVPNSNGSAPKENVTKAAISPALVKQLREETGAGMMDCKKALSETGGDIVKALEFLRKKGLASADKKASRVTAEGRIGSYIHDSRIGVLVEVNCETDFVSRGDIFKELVDDIAMQVAACPQVQYLVPEDVPEETVHKEREIEMQKEDLLSKPEQIRSKIVDGRIRKRLEELALLEQPYIKNDKVVLKDWVKQTIATIGENIKVKRFIRYNLGEGLEKKSQDFAAEVAAQTAAKAAPPPVKEQPASEEAKEVDKPPTVTISAALVKQLREETGAGMMDCKKALSESGGDLEKAQEYLRKKGLSTADKKSSRLAAEGRIGSYIHDSRIGVLIEVNCETDFVGRSEKFKELVDDLAMQVVACPQVQYVSTEDVPESIVRKEKELEMQREDLLSKPENIRERIVEGRISKRLGELALLDQPFIRDDSVLVKDLVKQTVAALGENIKVRRFIRFTLGETNEDGATATAA